VLKIDKILWAREEVTFMGRDVKKVYCMKSQPSLSRGQQNGEGTDYVYELKQPTVSNQGESYALD